MSEVAELLRQLVAIDSINPDLVPGGAGEGQIARFVAGWLEAAGLAVEIDEPVPGRLNVIGIARGRGGGRSLMLNAHMDTVGVEGMERPHEPYIQDNRLYGRGAYDMKGGLAAIMLGGAAAQRRRLRGDVIVTAVVDEEYASIGTSSILKKWRADAAIVTEPTELEICTAHKGFTWFKVETEGVAAHGSLPDLGVDAIVKMGKVLAGLEALDLALRAHPAHRQLGSGSVHASLIAGGQELSSYPRRCLLSIERRTIPGETLRIVEAEIPAIFERIAASDATFKATVRTTMTRDPFEISQTEPIVQAVRRQAQAVLGHEPGEGGATGWMDSALLAAAGIPTVIIGPGGAGAHAIVEWSNLTQVERAVEILLAVAEEFCM
ncbi:MAG: ArgE/DapE family deacylase [Chloroflexota bacterium]|nr:ArgE/DapE family deacylase [Chloroflexota bacterium]